MNQLSGTQMSLAFGGFLGQDVIMMRLRALEFTGCRSLEAFRSTPVGLYFWHEFLLQNQ